MSNKRFKEIKNLSADELNTKLRQVEADVFQIKMKKVTGQLADTANLWRVRKEIARLKTRQSQVQAEQRSK